MQPRRSIYNRDARLHVYRPAVKDSMEFFNLLVHDRQEAFERMMFL